MSAGFAPCASGDRVDEVPADLGRTVVIIGNFDGVHLGHQHVVRRAREVADERGLGTWSW